MVRWCLLALTALLVAGCAGGGPAHGSSQPRSRGAGGTDVVLVYTGQAGRANSGSGWVYDAGRGLVVTAFHVVDGYSAVQVQAGSDGWRAAAVVAAAPCEDVALLALDDTHGLSTLPFGDARALSRGTTVAGLGFGTSRGQARRGTYFGTVRLPRVALGPALRGIDNPPFDDLVETTRIGGPGYSGGPVVDRRRRLLGMIIADHTSPGGAKTTFANRIDRVRQTLAQLDHGAAPGWVGSGLQVGPAGVVVTGLVPGGYAGGGVLVKAIDGAPVGHSFTSWCRADGKLVPGPAELTIARRPGAPPERITAEINTARGTPTRAAAPSRQ